MEITKEGVQKFFDWNLDELIDVDENSLDFISQCHFGDMLMEEYEEGSTRLKLWRVLDENGGGVLVEYSGALNDYTWETVYEQQ